jgi:response regulator of citrate/malate metabolism
LIVEDEALVAMMAADMLTDLGAIVIGPAHTIPAALRFAQEEHLDLALLDVNIRDEPVDPVADLLRGKGVMILFDRLFVL